MRHRHGLKALKTRLEQAVDIVLPPRCVASGEIVDRQGAIAPKVWRDLSFIGAPLCDCCGVPFGFDMDAGSLCTDCLTNTPPFSSARAALVYDDISRNMILKFKHADHTYAVHTFLPWLKRIGEDMLTNADLVIPVPLHRSRLLQRRYNQAALIAMALAKSCKLGYVPAGLSRQRATPSQGHLDYKQRRKNVRNAFIVPKQSLAQIIDKKIVLVDDVYTTGATVKECAKVLLKNGAAQVDVLAVARVVKD